MQSLFWFWFISQLFVHDKGTNSCSALRFSSVIYAREYFTSHVAHLTTLQWFTSFFSSPSFPSLSLSEQSTGKLRCQDQKHTKASTRVFSAHPDIFLTLPTLKPLLYLCADRHNLCFTSRMVRVAFASIRLFAQSSQIDRYIVSWRFVIVFIARKPGVIFCSDIF